MKKGTVHGRETTKMTVFRETLMTDNDKHLRKDCEDQVGVGETLGKLKTPVKQSQKTE